VFIFLLVSEECLRGKERLTRNSVMPSSMDMRSLWIYTPVIALGQLVSQAAELSLRVSLRLLLVKRFSPPLSMRSFSL